MEESGGKNRERKERDFKRQKRQMTEIVVA